MLACPSFNNRKNDARAKADRITAFFSKMPNLHTLRISLERQNLWYTIVNKVYNLFPSTDLANHPQPSFLGHIASLQHLTTLVIGAPLASVGNIPLHPDLKVVISVSGPEIDLILSQPHCRISTLVLNTSAHVEKSITPLDPNSFAHIRLQRLELASAATINSGAVDRIRAWTQHSNQLSTLHLGCQGGKNSHAVHDVALLLPSATLAAIIAQHAAELEHLVIALYLDARNIKIRTAEHLTSAIITPQTAQRMTNLQVLVILAPNHLPNAALQALPNQTILRTLMFTPSTTNNGDQLVSMLSNDFTKLEHVVLHLVNRAQLGNDLEEDAKEAEHVWKRGKPISRKTTTGKVSEELNRLKAWEVGKVSEGSSLLLGQRKLLVPLQDALTAKGCTLFLGEPNCRTAELMERGITERKADPFVRKEKDE